MAGVLEMALGVFKGETVESLERELLKLNAQGAALATEIDDLAVQADELEDAGELARTTFAAKIASNRLKKLEARILETDARLLAAKGVAREKWRVGLLAAHAALAPRFIASARETQALLIQIGAAKHGLLEAGFRADYAGLSDAPSLAGGALCADDLVTMFEAALKPPVASPKPVSQPRATLERARSPREPAAANRIAPPYRAPPPRPPLRQTAAEGEVLFRLHRSGVERPGVGRLQAGDVIAVSPLEADALARNGAGDTIRAEQAEALPASFDGDARPRSEQERGASCAGAAAGSAAPDGGRR